MFRNLFTAGILKLLRSFYRDALKCRVGEILWTQEVLISTVLGCVLAEWGPLYFHNSAKPLDICVGFLSYAAIALGFCVGGVTIALTLPDRDFVVSLATLEIEGRNGDALSALFFVFCWTAVIHWVAIVIVLVFILVGGHQDSPLLAEGISHFKRVSIAVTSGISIYALIQFLITVLTLWQVGRNYIKRMRSDARSLQGAKGCGCEGPGCGC